MARRVRSGYTWAELLVTIVVIGLLIMLTLPALNVQKEPSRQAFCLNNQKQLATGHLSYHNTYDRFCGYVNSVGPDYKRASWAVSIFPHIDRADLWERWSEVPFDPAQPLVSHQHTYIESLICPSNPPLDEKASPLGYVVNGGFAGDLPRQESEANGIFHNQYPSEPGPFDPREAKVVTLQYLAGHDGASKTVMLSENLQWATTWRTHWEERAPVAFLWHADDADAPQRRINNGKRVDPAGNLDYARPSSYHPQGVNVVFADQHGKFIAETIDYRVYQQLLTPAGKESSAPDLPLLDESAF